MKDPTIGWGRRCPSKASSRPGLHLVHLGLTEKSPYMYTDPMALTDYIDKTYAYFTRNILIV